MQVGVRSTQRADSRALQTARMQLYVFSSNSLTNIWAGIGARTWAVSERAPAQMKGLSTKAAKVQVGSAGVLYCSATKSLTTPFLVRTTPRDGVAVTSIWPERWVLPFGITPLGDPSRQMHKDVAMGALEVLRSSGSANISHVLHIPATTVFSPNEVPTGDWAVLLEHLAT